MTAGIELTSTTVEAKLGDNICRLLNEAKPDGTVERREDVRHPFFRPVTIFLVGSERGRTGFSREISTLGIGLVHAFPLQQFDEVIVTVPHYLSDTVRIRTQIQWCHPIAGVWCISGGRFLGLVTSTFKTQGN